MVVDTDKRVEKEEGATIADIFYYQGEEYFRQAERHALEGIGGDAKNTIVATGGGLPTWGDNMAWMREHGVVVYLRHPRVMRVLTGPPYYREHDGDYARQALLGPDHVVVCGGTSANILERELNVRVKVNLADMRTAGGLPPVGRMEGVGIATEGILTLSRVLSALEEMRSPQYEPAAARMILDMIMRHDRIEFILGTKVNESHQDPGIPQDLELRRSVVRRIAQALERNYRKEVVINYY
jgi:hypothetical protein